MRRWVHEWYLLGRESGSYKRLILTSDRKGKQEIRVPKAGGAKYNPIYFLLMLQNTDSSRSYYSVWSKNHGRQKAGGSQVSYQEWSYNCMCDSSIYQSTHSSVIVGHLRVSLWQVLAISTTSNPPLRVCWSFPSVWDVFMNPTEVAACQPRNDKTYCLQTTSSENDGGWRY